MPSTISVPHALRAPVQAPHADTPFAGGAATAQALEQFISKAYRALSALPGFTSRPEQAELSLALARCWLTDTPLAAQAPTGTGKTIAYLVGGLAALSVLQSRGSRTPLVVATATKALQGQLLANDMDWLRRAGLVRGDEAVLVKGRGNYLCLRDAKDLGAAAQDAQADPEVYVADDLDDALDATVAAEFAQAYEAGQWDGDFDTWPTRRPGVARLFAASSETCAGRRCPLVEQCAFYKARARREGARILVTNQDMLLASLATQADGGEPVLGNRFLLLVDEAHHLPDKAVNAGASELAVSAMRQDLKRIAPAVRGLNEHPELRRLGAARRLDDKDLRGTLKALETLIAELGIVQNVESPEGADALEGAGTRRFARGVLPDALEALLRKLREELVLLDAGASALLDELREMRSNAQWQGAHRLIAECLRRLGPVKGMLSRALRATGHLLESKTRAKWLARSRVVNALANWSLHSSPLEGAQVLRPLLWEEPNIRACLVSATLTDAQGFGRFEQRCGLPGERARTLAMPYVLPYERSRLVVAAMRHTPKPREREKFLAELACELPRAIDTATATLVLFPSWSMLRALAPALRAQLGEAAVRVQGELPIGALIQAHCEAVDAGKPAVLAGVATMSEGLDLPGRYCEHVCVVSLPFAVPTGPLEEEVAERLGARYFAERSLPDATLRLVQICGRLVRRESDAGTITVFDRRLAAMGYGRQMLRALPPFTQVIEPLPRAA